MHYVGTLRHAQSMVTYMYVTLTEYFKEVWLKIALWEWCYHVVLRVCAPV